MNDNSLILAWLMSENKIGNRTMDKLINYFGSLKNIWDNLYKEKLNLVPILDIKVADILENKKESFKDELYQHIYKNNVKIITRYDNEYPEKLKNIVDPPYILYCKGQIEVLNNLSIGIVGSRKATTYGKWVANKFAKELSKYGITIVSGMALGIDTIVHKASLLNGGSTIAVLGCGLDIIYPQNNKGLYDNISSSNSVVISEYYFGTKPLAFNFPYRNRIISGLSSGILVVEAQEKSGTLITCSHAAEQGREVFAIPGNIDSLYSIGTNKLIKDGAKLVLSVEDILEELREFEYIFEKNKDINMDKVNNLSKIEGDILREISKGEVSFDDLKIRINYSINDLLSNLTLLEMKGLIIQNTGKNYSVI